MDATLVGCKADCTFLEVGLSKRYTAAEREREEQRWGGRFTGTREAISTDSGKCDLQSCRTELVVPISALISFRPKRNTGQ